MCPEDIVARFTKYQKDLQSVVRLLQGIARLDRDRRDNLVKLRSLALKLEREVERLVQGTECVKGLAEWLTQYRATIDDAVKETQRRFGVELDQELRKLGFSLSGQYPELKAGMFTIELDFDRMEAILWFGPRQERLGRCALSASTVARCLEKAAQKLGSRLPEDQLFAKLWEAYRRVTKNSRSAPVPIIQVLSELAHVIQEPRFLQDPRREHYRSYSRADFSYDLFRLRQFFKARGTPTKVHLVVATRAYTRRRSDFLWVPDSQDGKGTFYSHLQLEEGMSG